MCFSLPTAACYLAHPHSSGWLQDSKVSFSNVSALSLLRKGVEIKPAHENMRSAAALVAGTQSSLRAATAMCGNLERCAHHHLDDHVAFLETLHEPGNSSRSYVLHSIANIACTVIGLRARRRNPGRAATKSE